MLCDISMYAMNALKPTYDMNAFEYILYPDFTYYQDFYSCIVNVKPGAQSRISIIQL